MLLSINQNTNLSVKQIGSWFYVVGLGDKPITEKYKYRPHALQKLKELVESVLKERKLGILVDVKLDIENQLKAIHEKEYLDGQRKTRKEDDEELSDVREESKRHEDGHESYDYSNEEIKITKRKKEVMAKGKKKGKGGKGC